MTRLAIIAPTIALALSLAGCHVDANGVMSYPGLSASIASEPVARSLVPGMVADGDAVTGTGTDNGPALQAALNAIIPDATHSHSVTIGPGVFIIATRVDIPSGVSLVGAGQWATRLICPNAHVGEVLRLNGVGGIPARVSGLAVCSQVGGAWNAVGINIAANGCFIDNVWVNGFGCGVLFNASGATDSFLHSFAIEHCTTGLSIGTTDINVSHGTLYSCANGCAVDNGMAVSGPVLISGVRATTCWQNGFVIDNSRNVSLSNCSAAHNNAGAFSSAGFSVGGTSDGVQFTGCTAVIGGQPSATGIGMRIADYATNVSVIGGQFRGWNRGIHAANPLSVVVAAGVLSTGNTIP